MCGRARGVTRPERAICSGSRVQARAPSWVGIARPRPYARGHPPRLRNGALGWELGFRRRLPCVRYAFRFLIIDAESFRMSEPSEMRAPVSVPPALQSDEFDDPYPHLAAARRRSAVATAWPLPVATGAPELGPIYSVLAYDESVQVLRDHETYSSRGLSEAMGPLFAGAIIAMDEPEHRLYRALVAPAFRPKVLERWQTTVVQPAIDNVIDTFIDHDRVDLVEHLTFAFPVRVIARILGLPEQDVANFQ